MIRPGRHGAVAGSGRGRLLYNTGSAAPWITTVVPIWVIGAASVISWFAIQLDWQAVCDP